MALPVVNSWPFKIIDGYKSEWNAASNPIQYSIENTKWPVNSDDTAINNVSDSGGNVLVNGSAPLGLVVGDSVKIEGTSSFGPGTAAYNGIFKVLDIPVPANGDPVIDTPYLGVTSGGTLEKYYNNYNTVVRVYAGIDPAHTHAATKPIELIGTINQTPDTDNITRVDIRDFVKSKLNTDYDNSQSSWPNDLNGWTDFYISFAESYDDFSTSPVSTVTSEFT